MSSLRPGKQTAAGDRRRERSQGTITGLRDRFTGLRDRFHHAGPDLAAGP